MKIAIGCDHGGVEHKNAIAQHLTERGFEVKDFGIYEAKSVDYPDIAKPVALSVRDGECDLGILVCGTGIGMSIAANKIKGARAALLHDEFSAEMTRRHNNSNILCIGAKIVESEEKACRLADIFLSTEFEGGRHERRVNMFE